MLMLISRLSSLAHKLLMLMFMPMLAGDIKRFVAFAATSKFQTEAKQNELQACRDKLVGGTTLQVVFKGRHLNHEKPKVTVIGDLLHQINDRKLK